MSLNYLGVISFYFVFLKWFLYVVLAVLDQADFELTEILLPPQCWDLGRVSQSPSYFFCRVSLNLDVD